ncbi:Dedicator of cytokinesis protein 7 [Clonorchis sinensis]|uniref:Dedicator of cytokinesis protein 7 n=1 Tax=Clonorchis sinensis TaxID=79923 RepID=A0A419PQ28_CLOSI|nr:Dedicator of cytokinesis protein 7 [Clonorchis sinensis]
MQHFPDIFLSTLPQELQAGFCRRFRRNTSELPVYFKATSQGTEVARECVHTYDIRACFYNKKAKYNDSCDTTLKCNNFDPSWVRYSGDVDSKSVIPDRRLLAPGKSRPADYSDLPVSLGEPTLFLEAEFSSLQIEDGTSEPVFGLAFLYDVHLRHRISEVFHFDTNSDRLLHLFSGSRSTQQLDLRDWPTLARNCLFRITQQRSVVAASPTSSEAHESRLSHYPNVAITDTNGSASTETNYFDSADIFEGFADGSNKPHAASSRESCCLGGIFLVIRVEKVLQQGDAGDVEDLYNKDDKTRIETSIKWNCKRLGPYRMPLAWTAIDLTPLLLNSMKSNLQHVGVSSDPAVVNENRQTFRPSKSPSFDALRSQPSQAGVGPQDSSVAPHGQTEFPVTSDADTENLQMNDSRSPLIPSFELLIEFFYKQESDRMRDDDLGRYLSEIHRHTLSNILVSPFPEHHTAPRPTSVEMTHTSVYETGEQITPLTSLLHPKYVALRRLRQFSNLQLRVRLCCADAPNLVRLLRSTGYHVEAKRRKMRDLETVRCRPLLNPEGVPYVGPLFLKVPSARVVAKRLHGRLSKTKEAPSQKTMIPIRPIREVLELSSHRFASFAEYRNLLYVYPKSVALSPSRESSARNISVRIQLVHTEGSVAKIIPAIYGKSNSPTFVCEAFTPVLYHIRTPDMYDEIKLQLPEHLDENHYLLFTFFHVSCQSKKVESSVPLEAIVGYSWLPILTEGSLQDTDAMLLVSTSKPSSALAKIRPDLKQMSEKFYIDAFQWVDSSREVFHLCTTVVSSVFPKDANVEYMLAACVPSRIPQTLQILEVRDNIAQMMDCIRNASLQQLVTFLAPLLDGLLRLVLSGCLCATDRESKVSAFSAFYMMAQLVDRICSSLPDWNDELGRNRLLIAYLAGPRVALEELAFWSYFCDLPLFGLPLAADLLENTNGKKHGTSERLPEELLRLFSGASDAPYTRVKLIPLNSWWFVFELLIRLLVQHKADLFSKRTSRSNARYLLCEDDPLLGHLSSLIRTLTRGLVISVAGSDEDGPILRFNRALAYFIYDLIPLVPPMFILTEIWQYCNSIDSHLQFLVSMATLRSDAAELETILSCKLDLLKIISSHENYLLWNGLTFPELKIRLGSIRSAEGVLVCSSEATKPRSLYLASAENITNKLACPIFNLVSLLITGTIDVCMNTDLPKVQQIAATLLCDLFGLHEVDPRISDQLDAQLTSPRKPTLCSLSQVATLYLDLLDLVDQWMERLITTWSFFEVERPSTVGAARRASSTPMLDIASERDDSVSAESSFLKSAVHRKKKDTIFGERFLWPANRRSMMSKKPSDLSRLSEAKNDLPSMMLEMSTFRKWLLASLWVLRYSEKSLFVRWISDLAPDSRNRLITILYLALSTFRIRTNVIPCDTQPEFPAHQRLKPPGQQQHGKLLRQSGSKRSLRVRSRDPSTWSVFGNVRLSHSPSDSALLSGSHSHDLPSMQVDLTKGPPPEQKNEPPVPSWLAGEVTLAVTAILDRIISGLWDMDFDCGQPGVSLLHTASSTFDGLIPYRRKKGNVGTASLLDTLLRVLLYGLSLEQSDLASSRLLSSLGFVIGKFPCFVFEESPELLATCMYHLLTLCAMDRTELRTEAVSMLYNLLRSYFLLTKNLAGPRVHLCTAFTLLFAPIDKLSGSDQPQHPARLEQIPFVQRHRLLQFSLTNLLNQVQSDPQFFADRASPQSTNQATALLFTDLPNGNPTGLVANPVFQAAYDASALSFPEKIFRLVQDLRMLSQESVLLCSNLNVQQSASEGISERLFPVIDVLFAIAERCRALPELRVFWLIQMAEQHYGMSGFDEAAQCLTHAAAIIAEHLVNRNQLPDGFPSFGCADVSEAVENVNVLEESCACGPLGSGVIEPCCPSPAWVPELVGPVNTLDTSWYFSPAGWAGLVTWAAESFAKAGRHELVPRLYAKLVPVLEALNQYSQLNVIHGKIKEAYTTLEKHQRKKRLFSSYFRIGFYGALFGTNDGTEYIYREPPLTKLPDITLRIRDYYANKFGEERVVVLKDANVVDTSTLDPDKVYLQITYVEPHFDEHELRQRSTEAQRNYMLKRFVYSMPFTPRKGVVHGSLAEQYQRKVILTTERNFPYVKSRLTVVACEHRILSPIEVAHLDVIRRVQQLEEALNSSPIDIKFLQMILQGCVGAAVNQGPVEVATTFLSEKETDTAEPFELPQSSTILTHQAYVDAQESLRLSFRRMLDNSYRALCVNRELIGPDQVEYQQALEEQYENVKRKMAHLIRLPVETETVAPEPTTQSDVPDTNMVGETDQPTE